MRRRTIIGFALSLAALVAVASCRDKKTAGDEGVDPDDAPAHDEREAPASFKEGHGLRLAEETATALGVKTAEIEERKLSHVFRLTASVFDAGPPARASALVPTEIADEWERHPPTEAKIVAVQRGLSSALTQVEIVIELPGSPAVGTTLEVSLRGPAHDAVAVPRSAVLRSAMGTFVYVVNGDYLLGTLVKTGASDGDFVEIVDGLYAGDVVATAAVEQLRLTELRLTKGGGHSH